MKARNMDISGIKPRKPKQIAQAGMTLTTGMLFLPFIPFKKAKNYKPKVGK
jgi:hypothetical protein